MTYDLLTEAVVPCAKLDGTVEDLGLVEMCRQAHAIREIADPSPLTTFGTYRLLLAILHWLRPLRGHNEWAELWHAGRFPNDFIEALCQQGAGRFDLLDGQRPFYQVRNAADADTRPAADILYEVPGDTEINLFRHTYDSRVSLCLFCWGRGRGFLYVASGNAPRPLFVSRGQTAYPCPNARDDTTEAGSDGLEFANGQRYSKCSRSVIVETETWRTLESARLRAKAERLKDRRRKPKASDLNRSRA